MRATVGLGIILVLAGLGSPAFADDPPAPAPLPEEEGFMRSPMGIVLLGEGLFAVNAGMATLHPQAYGILGALLFPLAAGESDGNKAAKWAGLAAAESVAAYNIFVLDKDEDTNREIFVANMVGWHLFAGVVGTAAWLGDGPDEPAKVAFRYVPMRDGGLLRIAFAFEQ